MTRSRKNSTRKGTAEPPADVPKGAPAEATNAVRGGDGCDDGIVRAGGIERLSAWFASRGWKPYPFQRQAWDAYRRGESGLIHVPTGAGKTYAAYGGPLSEMLDDLASGGSGRGEVNPGLRLLYITPLRAVSRDIELALSLPVREMGVKIRVESRTGDTSSSRRSRQRRKLPQVLVTTPESLTLMLTWEDSRELLGGVRAVVIDEWHELMSSKRGTQTELALARLRGLGATPRVWALSATLDNLDEAASAATGVGTPGDARIISAEIERPTVIDAIVPSRPDAFPWAGHLGLSMLGDVIDSLDPSVPTLLFTNTRSQAELWHQALLAAKPEWAPITGLHHGSIDRAARERVESGLKDGSVRVVVATSSLDLGVDFAPVERVYQIGSPKGIARLMQRAGRSGHRPGATCRVTCVPTYGLELIEIEAARAAVVRGRVEPRRTLSKPLDVLAQHMVTCAMGGGFGEDALFEEVRGAYSYRDLTREEFDWVLRLVRDGGTTLAAYPEYRKLAVVDGLHRVSGKRVEQMHRLNVGTIVSESTMTLAFVSGRRLGSIEEYFVGNLSPGDRFLFAGRVLEFVRTRDLTAYVRPARGTSNVTPHWAGTRLPISESLAAEVRRTLERAAAGDRSSAELRAAGPIIDAQQRLSIVPAANELLVEHALNREGAHLFLYPFEGRLVHLGLAAVLALRLSRRRKATFTITANDYGFELLSNSREGLADLVDRSLFSRERLMEDAIESVNMADLSRIQFREVARVAGLVFQAYPGMRKSARQVHAGSSLLFDVFREFDPGSLFLEQARREVMERQFERERLSRTADRLGSSTLRIVAVERPTPLGLPLVIERTGGTLSSQSLAERLAGIVDSWNDPSTTSHASNAPESDSTSAARRSNSRRSGRSFGRRGRW